MIFKEWWAEHGSLDYDEMAMASDAWDHQQATQAATIEALREAARAVVDSAFQPVDPEIPSAVGVEGEAFIALAALIEE